MKTILRVVMLLLLVSPCVAAKGNKAEKASPETASVSAQTSLDDLARGLTGERPQQASDEEWTFIQGYAQAVHGNCAEAEQLLSKVDGKLSLIEDHIFYTRAICANRQKKFDQALNLLSRFDEAGSGSVWFAEALLERGRALRGLNRFSEAQAAFARALPMMMDLEQPRVKREIIATQMAAGDGDRAAASVRDMAFAATGERELSELFPLMDEIKKRFRIDIRAEIESPSQQLRLATNFIADSQWADAAVRLERAIQSKQLGGSDLARAKWMLAKCKRWTHHYDEAIALMEELLRDPSAAGMNDDISSTLATTYMKKNDYAKALAIRERMLDRQAVGSRAAAQIAFKIAFLRMDQGKYQEAIALWQKMASMPGAGEQGAMARWYVGWCRYMAGDYAGAAESFGALLGGSGVDRGAVEGAESDNGASESKIAVKQPVAEKASKVHKAGKKGKSGKVVARRGGKVKGSGGSEAKRYGLEDRIRYWRARSLEKIGRTEEARALYRTILSRHAGGYYAELSRRAVNGEKRSVEEFAHVRDVWPVVAAAHPPFSGEGGSIHYRRAIFFDRLGLHAEAARELRAATGAPAEAVMAIGTRDFAHDVASALARSRVRVYGDTPGRDAGERLIWEAAYPKAYEPVATRLANQEGLDPRLVWSIMFNESHFRPSVNSPAGAVGLMQLMPTTAGKVSRERGGDGDPSRLDLIQPVANMGYGIAYMGKLMHLFPGNVPAVVAAYNAGEEAVGRWLANGSFSDIEQWIEEIPYEETNLYVKKVMMTYWKYQRLYPEHGERK